MIIEYCDLCRADITCHKKFTVAVTTEVPNSVTGELDRKFALPIKTVCSMCKEKLKEYLQEQEGE